MVAPIVYKSAIINVAASGDAEIVAAVTKKRIAVHAIVMVSDATGGTARFESAAGGTALTGIMKLTANREMIIPFSEVPWFMTDSGAASEALSLEVGTGEIDGFIIYSEIPDPAQ